MKTTMKTTMKNILKKVYVHAFQAVSVLAVLATVANANQVCFACFHQPKPPQALDKYRRH